MRNTSLILAIAALLCWVSDAWSACHDNLYSPMTTIRVVNGTISCNSTCNAGSYECPIYKNGDQYLYNAVASIACSYAGTDVTICPPSGDVYKLFVDCPYWSYCDTQAEADSANCELRPGYIWSNGACMAAVCDSACSSQKSNCTGTWKDSVTYTVDAGTGDTTFTCVGYCRTAKMTYSDSLEVMDDSLSLIWRKNYADSVKVDYGANCSSAADTTGASGTPQYIGMTYFIDFNNVESQVDTAGISYVQSLYGQSCERALYRGIKNGRYIFWYSPDDIPDGVTNVVRIK